MSRKIVAGLLVGTAIIALMAGTKAEAQNANSSSTSASGSTSDSSSRSGAAAVSNSGSNRLNQTSTQGLTSNSTTSTGVTLNQTSISPDRLATTNSSSGGYNNTNTNWQGGHTSGDVTVRTTPQVYAPPVSGGNPCTLAVSGGVSVIGWGASAGGTFVDEACATRQKIAMIHNAGYRGAAKELMCDDKATYMAFRTSGEPCSFRQAFEPAGAPVPAPVAMPRNVTPQIAPVAAGPAYQTTGKMVCLDMRGREVRPGTPGASCGMI